MMKSRMEFFQNYNITEKINKYNNQTIVVIKRRKKKYDSVVCLSIPRSFQTHTIANFQNCTKQFLTIQKRKKANSGWQQS